MRRRKRKQFTAHHKRVIAERRLLLTKHTRLARFIETSKFFEVPRDEQQLLIRQLKIMTLYVDVLDERIEALRG